jgi:glycosyltransferase involved in cell wall biosynthesis
VGRKSGQSFIVGRLRSLKVLLATTREADIIVGALEHQAIFCAAIVSALTGKPAIGWVHKDLLYYASCLPPLKRLLYQAAIAFFFSRLAAVVAVSHGVATSLATLLPRLGNHVRVIYNPIDRKMIAKRAEEALPEWAAQVFSKPVVIAVGRLEDQKGFDVLIQAHAILREARNDHHLLIVGEGTQRDTLVELVRTLGVTASVFMPGFCNPFSLMARSNLLALSSRFEGLPTVLIEAMILNLPIVATRCPSGPEELLNDGRCGILVRSEDAADLATHLGQALKEPAHTRSLALAAHAKVETFDPAAVTQQWELLLKVTADGSDSMN